ncbi:MAG: hypothetical protein R6U98_22355 [Pirellulaceae bacterium]
MSRPCSGTRPLVGLAAEKVIRDRHHGSGAIPLADTPNNPMATNVLGSGGLTRTPASPVLGPGPRAIPP